MEKMSSSDRNQWENLWSVWIKEILSTCFLLKKSICCLLSASKKNRQANIWSSTICVDIQTQAQQICPDQSTKKKFQVLSHFFAPTAIFREYSLLPSCLIKYPSEQNKADFSTFDLFSGRSNDIVSFFLIDGRHVKILL